MSDFSVSFIGFPTMFLYLRESCSSVVTLWTDPQRIPLITTDGYRFYERAIRKCFGKCLYRQVIKTRRNDHVTKVDRRMTIGDKRDFDKLLLNSEDSETLNTSFIERLNLTTRQSTSFLTRRTTSFARFEEFLEKQLDILRCHYNFLRPHRALKFGPVLRTPAMQAGLAKLRFTFRDVFTFLVALIWMGKLDSIRQSAMDWSGYPAPINTWWRKHQLPAVRIVYLFLPAMIPVFYVWFRNEFLLTVPSTPQFDKNQWLLQSYQRHSFHW